MVKKKELKFKNEDFFDRIDTVHKAYWLGFIAADGYPDSKRDRLMVKLTISDKSHLDQFCSIFGKSCYTKSDGSAEISIASKRMVDSIIRHSSSGLKQNRLDNPDFFEKIPDRLKSHFIRGYFDGDGCIDKNGQAAFYSCSKRFLIRIGEYIVNSIGSNYGYNIYQTSANGYRIVWRISDDPKLFAFLYPVQAKGYPRMERKYTRFRYWSQKKFARVYWTEVEVERLLEMSPNDLKPRNAEKIKQSFPGRSFLSVKNKFRRIAGKEVKQC